MSLFGKKEKEEAEPAVDSPAAPKSSFQSTADNTSQAAPVERVEDMTTCFGKNLTIAGNVSGEGNLIVMGSFEGDFDLKGQFPVWRERWLLSFKKELKRLFAGHDTSILIKYILHHLEISFRHIRFKLLTGLYLK